MKFSRAYKKSLTDDIIYQGLADFASRVEVDPYDLHIDEHPHNLYPYTDEDENGEARSSQRSQQQVNISLLDCVSKRKNTQRKRRIRKKSTQGRRETYEPPESNQEYTLDEKEVAIDDSSLVAISEPCLSRFEHFPCGSKSIVCTNERVIFIVVWTVSPKDLSSTLRATPVVNNSSYDNQTILSAVGHIMQTLDLNIQREIEYVSGEGGIEDASMKSKLIAVCINAMEKEITSMFSENLSDFEWKGQVSPSKKLKSGLQKFDMTPGESLDYFGLYSDTMQYELNNISRAEQRVENEMDVNGHNGQRVDHEIGMSGGYGQCLICFDDLGKNGLQMLSCGHKACTSCWRDLIQVAASSGDAETCCPSFKCPNKIGIHDMIQIELGSDIIGTEEARVIEDSSRIIANLVRFRIERFIFMSSSSKKTALPGIQFCPTPSCNNVFSPRKINYDGIEDIDESSFDGSNIHFCTCGTSRCGDCNQDSHLGLSCEEFSKVTKQFESGRMDAEMKSLQWVKQNTSPCPRCNFPINKTGGCNHVRCSKCQYYFCWVCGGEGNECFAYECFNKKNGIEEESSEKFPDHIDLFTEFLLARDGLAVSLRKMRCGENKFVALEVQLRQVLVWARSKLISSLSLTSLSLRKTKLISNLLGAIRGIELQLDVLEIRSLGKEQHFKRIVQQSLSLDQSLQNCIMEKTFKNKYSFQDLINISTLLSMNVERFSSHSSSLIVNMIEKLRRGQLKQMNKRQNLSERMTSSYPLNEKAKPKRQKWTCETVDLEESEEEHEVGHEKKQRWKGKRRLKARRSHALMIINNF